ncbi:HET-domain-containing protein [Daldinia eschscholtzii]|nr:HET-domain-containing protein [Daldinia eschscholtzii]
MTRYCYSPLSGQNHIRHATLHPGRFEDNIFISFQTSPFSNTTSPYEALSYVWGSDKSSLQVYVKGAGPASTNKPQDVEQTEFDHIPITRNLDIVLRHLRYAEAPRVVWIDALCINQEDDVEKGPQVAMMSEIYRLAGRVVAWLGPEENDSNHAMYLLGYLGSQVDVDIASRKMVPAAGCSDPTVGNLDVPLPLRNEDIPSVYHLLCRKWFERLWIRQEIYLAGPEAVVMCGLSQVKWSIFRRGLMCAYIKPPAVLEYTDRYVARLRFLEGFIFHEPILYLVDVRYIFNSAQCHDPRDRLYAIWAFFTDVEKALVPPPDYTQPYEKLYATVIRNFIAHFGSLNSLSECELQQQDGKCPSWVSDWSKPFANFYLSGLAMGFRQFGAWYEFPEPEVLRVMSVYKCTVSKVHQFPVLPRFAGAMLEQLRALLMVVDQEEHHTVEEYTRLLAHDRFAHKMDPLDHAFPDFEQAKRCVEFILSDRDIHSDGNREYVLSPGVRRFLSMSRNSSGFRLVQCTGGYIGVTAAPVQPYDEVHFVLGCSTPLLLRPRGDCQYRVVGSCFVPGLSFGEALLGPLPDDVVPIQKFDERFGRHILAYKNGISGDIFYDDPRLESLPIQLDFDEFRRQLQSNPLAMLYIKPEALKACGVDLNCIDLV